MEHLTDEEYRIRIATAVERSVGRGKHCARSAVRNMTRAWALKSIDPEMAAFRALTAEEEAASALLYSLKRHHYQLSEQLKPREHVQKAAVYPFFLSVESLLAKGIPPEKDPHVEFDESEPEPRLRIKVRGFDQNGILHWIYPVPPLHFDVRIDEQITDFSDQINELVSHRNAKTIIDFARRRANRRNQLLFAWDTGVPNIQGIDDVLTEQERITYRILTIFLLVDPYPIKQMFVGQCLHAFLKMLKLTPKEMS